MAIIKVREILVPAEEAKRMERYLTVEPNCKEECLPEDKNIIYTADFGGGWEMDVKVSGVQYDSDEPSNTAWSEAVLFKDGCERCFTEPSDSLLGDWELECEGITYVAKVMYKPEPGRCPNCGSRDVESKGVGEFDREYFYNPVTCCECGRDYWETYKFEWAQ